MYIERCSIRILYRDTSENNNLSQDFYYISVESHF